jgi:hypothetical protein
MKPHSLSMNKLALDLRVPVTRIADIVAERRGSRQTPRCGWLAISKQARNSGSTFRPSTIWKLQKTSNWRKSNAMCPMQTTAR